MRRDRTATAAQREKKEAELFLSLLVFASIFYLFRRQTKIKTK